MQLVDWDNNDDIYKFCGEVAMATGFSLEDGKQLADRFIDTIKFGGGRTTVLELSQIQVCRLKPGILQVIFIMLCECYLFERYCYRIE